MSEIDTLFDRLGPGRIDPNSLPQEGGIGAGTIQGAGFVQIGGSPRVEVAVEPGPIDTTLSVSFPLNQGFLAPVSIRALMSISKLDICDGCTGTNVGMEWALLEDLGQGAALTVVLRGTFTRTTSGLAERSYSPSAVVEQPAGMYWLIMRVNSEGSAGATYDVTYKEAVGSVVYRANGATLTTTLPAVGAQYTVVASDWIAGLKNPQAAFKGTVFGGIM